MFKEVDKMSRSGVEDASENTPMLGGGLGSSSKSDGTVSGFFAKHGKVIWWTIVGGALILAVLMVLNSYGLLGMAAEPPLEPRTPDVENLFLNTWPIPDVNQRLKQDYVVNPSQILKSGSLSAGAPLTVPANIVAEAYAEAQKAQTLRLAIEDRMREEGQLVKKSSPTGKHNSFMQPTLAAAKLSTDGFYMDQASKYAAKRLNLTKEQAAVGVKVEAGPTIPCIPPLNVSLCTVLGSAGNIYHSADGLCNNVNNAGWGAYNQPFRRVLMPAYADMINAPRVASDGGELPHPRKISSVIHPDMQVDGRLATLLLPVLGQFIAHEVTSTALGVGTSSRVLNCCAGDKVAPVLHPECIPFSVNETSEMYKIEGEKCTNQWRSAAYPSCTLGARNQFNQATSYIDASVIYGSTDDRVRMYREVSIDNPHGYMQTYRLPNGKKLLPVSTDLLDGCNIPEEVEKGRMCFTSGDPRVNEQVALTSMHLLWVRQHNRIADQLIALYPETHDGKAYFETREIIIAQMQHVIYNEFLPVLLGKELCDAAGITVQTEGYYAGYDVAIDASVSNVFDSAAFRVGHSMMQGKVKLMDESRNVLEEIPLHQLMYDPFRLWDDGKLDDIIRGHISSPAGQVDNYFTSELTKHMFENKNGSLAGLDLAAINTQRGRDHGLPAYIEWRKVCGLTANITSFDNLAELWEWNALELARGVYKTVADVDLYTGMLSEKRIPGAMVGPTVGCLIADQFSRLRKGDRFWYEGNSRAKPFPEPQLAMIRKITLARIICDNSDNIQYVQLRPLEPVSATNPLYSCSSTAIPTLTYSEWKDNISEGLLPKKN